MDAKVFDQESGIPKSSIGHLGISKSEMNIEESDTGSYSSCSFVEGEEMEHDFNDFYSRKYMRNEEDEIENHPVCFCGRLAKRRMSMTEKNPNRWFFNCAKRNFNTQCGYFEWYDELYEDDNEDNGGVDNEEDEYATDDEEIGSNLIEHEDEKMVLSEEQSNLTCQASTVSMKVDQVKEMNFFPQYPDLSLLVQELKPHTGLDGSILSLAPPG